MIESDAFVQRWVGNDTPRDKVAAQDLDRVEQSLAVRLPKAHRDFLLHYGAVGSHAGLLSHIVDNELDIEDLGWFLKPDDVVETTLAWRSQGLPENLVAFALDSAGSMFCFRCAGGVPDQCADEVLFFDHDFAEVHSTDLSFREWLARYASL